MHFPIFAATRLALDIEPYSNRAHCNLSIPYIFCILTRYIGRAAEAQSRGSMHMLTNMHRHAHHPSSAATRRALDIEPYSKRSHRQLSIPRMVCILTYITLSPSIYLAFQSTVTEYLMATNSSITDCPSVPAGSNFMEFQVHAHR